MASDSDGQFVTLGIGREVFAVPVSTVLEILDHRPVFRLPDAPAYMAGLIDVRGRGVPVIDLRLKLGLPAIEATESTRILVLEVPMGGKRLVMGLVADRVFEVAALGERQIEPPPDIGIRWRSDYIQGIGRHGDTFVIILDLDRLFSAEEAAFIGSKQETRSDSAARAAASPEHAAAS
jgi:purine-binding chemotaxis protein CheW